MNMSMVVAIAGIVIGIFGAALGVCIGLKNTADPLRRRTLIKCILIIAASAAAAMLLFAFLPLSLKFYFWVPFPFAFLFALLLWRRNIK